ncbi:MAG: diguanylate cyclase, partial [Clostridium sp.]|nr:diguanylate cyclase [Clostridium sp.]
MNELEQYKERLRIALSAARICIFEVDILRQQYTFFENAETIFGVSGDDILKDVQPYSVLEPEAYRLAVSEYFSHPDDWEVIEDAFAQILNGKPAIYDARMKAGGSGFIWCRIHVTPIIEDNKPVRMIGVIMDITDTKKKTESLEQAVNRDAFTGFYNKEYSITLIRDILEERKNLQHALVILDIDKFTHFNDTYGPDQGD